ncbi:MAG: hypothetical protein ABJ215_17415 [Alphaproteobacteria bacterium]
MKSGLMIAATALLVATFSTPAFAGAIHKDVPEKVDPDKRYLIYLHGAWLESHALSEPHPKRGLYQYEKILAELAARDFEVISELRVGKPNPRKYTRTRVIPQVNALLAKDVPPNRITVVGFSKGGMMTLVLSAQAKMPALNIVNLAGCGKGRFRAAYDSFLKNDAAKMQGRMLSLYDPADLIAGTCAEAAMLGTRLKMTEEALKPGKGHGTFYSPNPAWLDRIASWSAAAGKPKTN